MVASMKLATELVKKHTELNLRQSALQEKTAEGWKKLVSELGMKNKNRSKHLDRIQASSGRGKGVIWELE